MNVRIASWFLLCALSACGSDGDDANGGGKTAPEPGPDGYAGQDLSGYDFSGMSLTSTSFVGANLSNADFTGFFCGNCDFSDADLRGANFYGAILNNPDFYGANLEGADFGSAMLHGSGYDKDTTCSDGSKAAAEPGSEWIHCPF
jgi:uncharacterized protein YjbI with pentapeptide repeats